MTYLSQGEKIFQQASGDFEECTETNTRRSDARLKTFLSCKDNRIWALDEEDRYKALYDLVSSDSKTCTNTRGGLIGKYVPVPALIDMLMSDKDSLIRRQQDYILLLEEEIGAERLEQLRLNRDERFLDAVSVLRPGSHTTGTDVLYEKEEFFSEYSGESDRDVIIRKDAEIIALKSKLSVLEDAMCKLEKIDEIINENRSLRVRLKNSQDEINQLMKRESHLLSQIEHMRTKGKIQKEIDQARRELFEADCKGKNTHKAKLLDKIENLKSEFVKARSSRSLLNIREDNEETEIDTRRAQLKLDAMFGLERQVEDMKKKLTNCSKKERELELARGECDRLRKRVDELAAYEAQCKILQGKMHRLESIMAENELLTSRMAELDKLEMENQQLRAKVEQTRLCEAEAEENRDRILQLQCAVADMEDEIKDLLNEIERLAMSQSNMDLNELETVRMELEEKNKKLALCEQELAEIPHLEAEIDHLKNKLCEFMKQAEEEKAALSKKLKESEETITRNEQELRIAVRREDMRSRTSEDSSCSEVRSLLISSKEIITKVLNDMKGHEEDMEDIQRRTDGRKGSADGLSCAEVQNLLRSSKGIISKVLNEMGEHQQEMEDLRSFTDATKNELKMLKERLGSAEANEILKKRSERERGGKEFGEDLGSSTPGKPGMGEKTKSSTLEAVVNLDVGEDGRPTYSGGNLTDLQNRIRSLELENANLKKLVESLKRENNTLKGIDEDDKDYQDQEKVEKVLSLMKGEMEDMRKQAAPGDDISALNNEIKRLQGLLEKSEKEKNPDIQALQNELERLRTLEEKCKEKENEINALKAELGQTSDKIDAASGKTVEKGAGQTEREKLEGVKYADGTVPQNEIDRLKNELREKNEALNRLENELKNLKQELDKKNKDLLQSDDFKSLARKSGIGIGGIEKLQNELNQKNEELDKLRKELAQMKEQSGKPDMKKDDTDNCKAELEKRNEELDKLKKELAKLKEQPGTADGKKGEPDNLKLELDKRNDELDKLRKELAQIKEQSGKLDTKKEDTDNLKSELEKRNDELDKLKKELAKLKEQSGTADVTKEGPKLKGDDTELQATKDNLDKANKDIKKLTDEKKALQDENENLKKELEALRKQIKNLDPEAANLGKKVAETDKDKDNLKEELQRLKNLVKSLETERDGLLKEKNKAEADLKQLKSEKGPGAAAGPGAGAGAGPGAGTGAGAGAGPGAGPGAGAGAGPGAGKQTPDIKQDISDKTALENTIKNMEIEADNLRKKLAKCDEQAATIKSLNDEIARLKNENNYQRGSLDLAEKNLGDADRLKRENEALKKKLADCENKMAENEKKLSSMRDQLSTTPRTNLDSPMAQGARGADKEELVSEDKFEDSLEEIPDFIDPDSAADPKEARLLNEMANLRQKLSKALADNKNLEAKNKKLMAELESTKKQLKQCQECLKKRGVSDSTGESSLDLDDSSFVKLQNTLAADDHKKNIKDIEKKFKEKIAKLEKDNAEKIKKLMDQHEKEGKNREKTYKANVTNLKHGHEADIKKFTERHKESVMRLQQLHEDEIQELNTNYETQLEALQNQSENLAQDLTDQSSQKINTLVNTHNEEIKAIQDKFNRLMEEKEAQYLFEISSLQTKLTENMDEVEDYQKSAMADMSEVIECNAEDLTKKYERELKKLKRKNEKKFDVLKHKYEDLITEERKKYEEQLEDLLRQLQSKDDQECECKKLGFVPVPGKQDGPLGFRDILQKILDYGIDSLTFNELALVHKRTCLALSGVVMDEDTTANVEPAIGDGGCQHIQLAAADKEQLLHRIFQLENDIAVKQVETHDAVMGLEMAVKAERRRLQEVRQSLQNEQEKNTELKLMLNNQSRIQTDLKVERDLLDRQASAHEQTLMDKVRELERERAERRVLEEQLAKERNNVRQITMMLESERERSLAVKKRDQDYIESMKQRLEHALTNEHKLQTQVAYETRSKASLELELKELQRSLTLMARPDQTQPDDYKYAKERINQAQQSPVLSRRRSKSPKRK